MSPCPPKCPWGQSGTMSLFVPFCPPLSPMAAEGQPSTPPPPFFFLWECFLKTINPAPAQGRGDSMQTMPFGSGAAFYAVGCVQPDGTVREFGGTDAEPRTWASVEAFHEARGRLGGTLIRYFPPSFDADAETSCHVPASLLQTSYRTLGTM